MKEKLNQEINLLERKMGLLISEINSLRQENKRLNGENSDLKENLSQKEKQIAHFKNQMKISKIVQHAAVTNDTAGLKDQIDEYIREIDKCIAHISDEGR
ncbi:hypothetical protein AB9P05_12595 [Roseivirga sp. BDSF3-8]|uniref:hypothetical protein n=1 Tax=Roseivirga sp. BDSF3-8 TaxID=3241598 RepID=UPI0035321F15